MNEEAAQEVNTLLLYYVHKCLMQSWYVDEAKQAALLVRALNFNVGLQKYMVVFITNLQGIAYLSTKLKSEGEIFTGILVIERDVEPRGPGTFYADCSE